MSPVLDTADVRQLLRLTSDVLDLRADPPAAARLALERLCTMTGASLGMMGVAIDGPPPRLRPVQSFSSAGTRRTARPASLIDRPDPLLAAAIDTARDRTTHIARPTTRLQRQLVRPPESHAIATLRHGAGLGDGLYSVLPMQAGPMSVISLHQGRSRRRPWATRERTLVDMLHPELLWLTRPTPRPEPAPHPDLSPRQQQTLRLLLHGMSEKQIGASLDLSVHTVHVYVKSLYRSFRVTSRSELMAKWVKPGE